MRRTESRSWSGSAVAPIFGNCRAAREKASWKAPHHGQGVVAAQIARIDRLPQIERRHRQQSVRLMAQP